jgi:hypothetical protein
VTHSLDTLGGWQVKRHFYSPASPDSLSNRSYFDVKFVGPFRHPLALAIEFDENVVALIILVDLAADELSPNAQGYTARSDFVQVPFPETGSRRSRGNIDSSLVAHAYRTLRYILISRVWMRRAADSGTL